MNNKQKFFSQLQNLYVGARLDGKGGMAKLLQFKCQYFAQIKPLIEAEIKKSYPDIDDSSQTELYEKLYTFFSSYLTDGGSIYFSDTPAYKNVYAKVYFDKEDTALFYKTKDLYYVKSQVMYQSVENLTFSNNDKAIAAHFDFDAGDYIPTNNNTKEKVLILFTGLKNRKLQFKVIEQSQIIKDDEYNIIDCKLKGYNEATTYIIKKSSNQLIDEKVGFYAINYLQKKDTKDAVIKFLGDNGVYIAEEIVTKAINIYKKQNEVDFFIHKNAKGFLTEQFNLFMYNYLSNDMDSLLEQKRLNNILKIKKIAFIVIDYIAKFEDELKAIWNKPKFVRNTNYVVTLDKLLTKDFDISILTKHSGIESQIKEWQDLGMVSDGFNNSITEAKDMFEGSKYKYLPFDTKHFDNTIKYQILGLFDNFDDECDGVLIKSDNYQALNTIMPKYKEQIDLIYIDPPFNTGSDFSYLDNYQDSTWCSIMYDRLNFANAILSDKGSIYVHLDYRANHYNRMLMDNIFGVKSFKNEITWNYLVNKGNILDKYPARHDNILFYARQYNIFNKEDIRMEASEATLKRWSAYADENGVVGFDKLTPGMKKVAGKGEKPYLLRGGIQVDWVTGIPALNSGNSNEVLGYDTQKPEDLLALFIRASSNETSLVCDFFAGSGTALAVAHKLNRRWLGVEMGGGFSTLYYKEGEQKIGNIGRMKLVLSGHKVGISKNQEVKSGGVFKYYELEQYEDVLDKAIYQMTDKSNLAYDFSNNEKLAHDGLTIDYSDESNPIYYSFEKLYPDIDIWETISNFYGYEIKKYLSCDNVVYLTRDGREITLSKDKITFDNMPELKSLIWWQ
jgi:adenine-specific DNA-methyltransferase